MMFIIYNILNIKSEMKKIILIAMIWILAWWYTNANDCNLVKSETWGNFIVLENWEYNEILPQDAIRQSMINLKNFCCSQKIFTGNCDTDSVVDNSKIFPSSAYLYDHILDVSMRRLDAKQTNDNWEDLIYGLSPDDKWKAWRNFITEHGNSKDWSIPLAITNEFEKYWSADTNTLKSWKNNYTKKSDLDDLWWKNLDNYWSWNLVNKYMWVCETSLYLYFSINSNPDINKLYTAYSNCENLSNERIKSEYDYTKAILMQKWNKLLYNNIKSYLDNYFSQNKLISLQQLVFNIKNTFNEVNKAVKELVNTCN